MESVGVKVAVGVKVKVGVWVTVAVMVIVAVEVGGPGSDPPVSGNSIGSLGPSATSTSEGCTWKVACQRNRHEQDHR